MYMSNSKYGCVISMTNAIMIMIFHSNYWTPKVIEENRYRDFMLVFI